MMILLSLTVLTNCSQRAECPKVVYPELNAINKIPSVKIVVKHGKMDRNSTKKAFKTIKALRVSEHYYYSLIQEYGEKFTEDKGKIQ